MSVQNIKNAHGAVARIFEEWLFDVQDFGKAHRMAARNFGDFSSGVQKSWKVQFWYAPQSRFTITKDFFLASSKQIMTSMA